MVTKGKKGSAKKGRVKVGKLKVNKETVKDLTAGEQKRVKGGIGMLPPRDTKRDWCTWDELCQARSEYPVCFPKP